MCLMSETWNKKRISAMPSRCDVVDDEMCIRDSLSVALWAVISVGKGLSAGLDVVPSIILGTVTAVGGGILRDVFMNREPEAFQAGAMYGSAALIGSTVYALMAQNLSLIHI